MSPDPHTHAQPAARWSTRKRITVTLASFVGLAVLLACGMTVLGAIVGPQDEPERAGASAPRGVATAVEDDKYAALDTFEWAQLAANPMDHLRKTYTIYGAVTQADAVIGPEAALASVDGVPHDEVFLYGATAVLTGDAEIMDKLIEGDQFVAEVTVLGPYEYQGANGKITAPSLRVNSLKVRIPAPGDRP